jgi:glutamate racemase
VIGVLATAGTLKASKYLNTKGQFQDNVRIEEHVGEGFVQLVERGELDGPEAERVVRASLQPLLDAGADTIVLGCTHYPFLLPVIERIAGPGVRVIDPAPAVARQLVHILTERGLLNSHSGLADSHSGLDPESPALEILASGDPTTLRRLAARISCEQ